MVEIVTIGYGGKRPTDFFKELEDLEPDLIIDVRENPRRAYLGSYTKSYLQKRLGGKYIWLPECGNTTRKLPPTLKSDSFCIRRIAYFATRSHINKIVLLCAEKDETRCHRLYVKQKVEMYLGGLY